jgi:hypothetical protein
MKTWKLAGVAAVVAFGGLLGGCGDGDIKRFIELDTMKAQAFKDGGDDCDKMAKTYGDWKSKYGKEYKELQGKLKDKYKDKGDAEKAMGDNAAKMKDNAKAVIDGMFKCASNDALGKAIEAD